MKSFENIVILHPGAIGDVIMGTPVAAALKKQFPGCRVIYLTHGSLFPLLKLCPAIDEFVTWEPKAPVLAQLKTLKLLKPDLVVDLTSSTRTRLLRLFCGCRSVGYHKQRKSERPIEHVVDRYMQSLHSLVSPLPAGRELFPTLAPGSESKREVFHKLGFSEETRVIAIVPGVGKHRPNRAWPANNWVALVKRMLESMNEKFVLIGGPDDAELVASVEREIGCDRVVNTSGKLALPQTAALLSQCEFVISGDTGPSHISVAVGKPVIALMGPTFPQRSGPYRNESIGLEVCDQCQCQTAKKCLLNDGTAAGACMQQITVDSVLQQVQMVRRDYTSAFAGAEQNSLQ